MITSSRTRSNRSKLVALIAGTIKGSLGFSRVRFFRNDEIGFRGLGSKANMFISGGLKEALMVGFGGWYNGSLSFFSRRRFILWPGLGVWLRWKWICYGWESSTCLEVVIIRICYG